MFGEKQKRFRAKDMAVIAANAAIISVSAWISIPFAVNFTLQTLAVFTVCSVFDFKRSVLSITVYILIGLCGIPVFSGFAAGPTALLGPTGGYLIGFLSVPVIMRIFSIRNKKSIFPRILIMLAALVTVYIFGSLWFYFVYASGTVGISKIFLSCVIPFIIPDVIKICIAATISQRLSKVNI